ncbi:hypothetical protein F5B22DRAFT_29859 [Xylaria bambusicola]|uniref:uncharacterized protein n=1 Tax=Xylaria bambusicola TaxID=326684 RepID=UPI002007AD3D|nr:uncharacterized protein F5B22DRAFT_29859 [Xylaria bambusicola]KAI0528282.1 hypothetical protein F5B22DRAFT_29859 [Xylaria bambusicola]
MRVPRAFLSLPPSLLLLLAAQLHAHADSKINNKDELQTLPTAVRKMSLDEGEKFMPEYYAFAPADFYVEGAQAPMRLEARGEDTLVLTPEEEALLMGNSSATLVFRPPFPRHYYYENNEASSSIRSSGKNRRHAEDQRRQSSLGSWSLYRRAIDVLARLQGRDFNCPSGTHVCSNINEPNYCCTDGTTCFVVENAPDAGNVGCCPDGQNCGGSVAQCADGNTACPADEGGGCCIPGFVCADIGCVQTVSSTTSTTSRSTAITTTTTPTSASTPTTSSQSTTSTPTMTTTTSEEESTSASGTGLPPVRPTSSTPTTTGNSDYCPTGFYACVASAGSGCCRTGRDCSTTSCPPVASTTIETNGATVVVPLTDAQVAPTTTATCASGWFLCGANAGPVSGCCPSGYMCGTASCTLSAATATATVQKEMPGNAAGGWRVMRGEGVMSLAIVAIGWLVLP